LNALRKVLKHHGDYFRNLNDKAWTRVARETQVLDLRMRNAPAALSTSVLLSFPNRPKSKPAADASASASFLDTINALLG
jgi:hypothetical protein